MSTTSPPQVLLAAALPPFLMEPLLQAYTCHHFIHAADKSAFLATHGPQVRGLVMTGGTVLDTATLDALPALEIISVFGVGYDGVPVAYCKGRGIHITNTPDVLTDDVADIAVALVLMTARKLLASNRFLHAGKWLEGQFELAWKVSGKKAGIFGLGRIGKAIAKRLAALDMEIGYHGRTRQDGVNFPYFPSVTELAGWADFLIVASPGGPGTKHAVNEEVLKALGTKGTLINIARGSIVDQTALTTALQTGAIRAAGLDVYDNEPHVTPELLALENAVLLPHVGSGTHETRQAMADLVLGNLAAHFAGKPLLTPV